MHRNSFKCRNIKSKDINIMSSLRGKTSGLRSKKQQQVQEDHHTVLRGAKPCRVSANLCMYRWVPTVNLKGHKPALGGWMKVTVFHSINQEDESNQCTEVSSNVLYYTVARVPTVSL
jgi:hypothetical protein